MQNSQNEGKQRWDLNLAVMILAAQTTAPPHPGGSGNGTQVPEGPGAQSALSESWSLVWFATREHHPRSICGLNRLFCCRIQIKSTLFSFRTNSFRGFRLRGGGAVFLLRHLS